jgi:hypothetical protein
MWCFLISEIYMVINIIVLMNKSERRTVFVLWFLKHLCDSIFLVCIFVWPAVCLKVGWVKPGFEFLIFEYEIRDHEFTTTENQMPCSRMWIAHAVALFFIRDFYKFILWAIFMLFSVYIHAKKNMINGN